MPSAPQLAVSLIPVSGAPMGQSYVDVKFARATTESLASIQWTFLYDTAEVPSATFAVSGTAAAATKQITCFSPQAGTINCIVYGPNSTPIADGVVARITLGIARAGSGATTLLRLTKCMGATPRASELTVGSLDTRLTL